MRFPRRTGRVGDCGTDQWGRLSPLPYRCEPYCWPELFWSGLIVGGAGLIGEFRDETIWERQRGSRQWSWRRNVGRWQGEFSYLIIWWFHEAFDIVNS